MGEIAESMLNGDVCEECGVPNEGESLGVPWRCPDCAAPKRRPRASPQAHAKAKATRGEPLPKWQLASEDPVVIRYHCKFCTRHFGQEPAVWDHLRDVHGLTPP